MWRRPGWLGLGVLAVAVASACKGRIDATSAGGRSGDASTGGSGGSLVGTDSSSGGGAVGDDAGACAVDVPSSSGSCGTGQLVLAPTSTITTPDPWPVNPVLAGSLASDQYLAVWTDDPGLGVLAPIWASLIQPGVAGATASPTLELSSTGACPVATWTGAGFAVVWTDDSGLRLEQLNAQGAPLGSPAALLSGPSEMCAMSLVSTGAGLAVAWSTSTPTSQGEAIVRESVALIDASGTASTPILLDTVGPGAAANVALAELAGQTYVAFVEWPDTSADTAVSRVDGSLGAAVRQATVPGFFQSFVAAGGQLWLGTYGGGGPLLYTALPGVPFQAAGQGCSAFADLAVDGCGQLAGLGNMGFNPGGTAGFYAQSFGGDASSWSLGSMTESALAGAASTFGVLWFARIGPGGGPAGDDAHQTGTLSFTTLSRE